MSLVISVLADAGCALEGHSRACVSGLKTRPRRGRACRGVGTVCLTGSQSRLRLGRSLRVFGDAKGGGRSRSARGGTSIRGPGSIRALVCASGPSSHGHRPTGRICVSRFVERQNVPSSGRPIDQGTALSAKGAWSVVGASPGSSSFDEALFACVSRRLTMK
jgi:hypothetical protein